MAGLGGGVESLGVVEYQPGFNTGLGFDGITIALFGSGRTPPFGVIPAALWGHESGGRPMQFGVAKKITDVIQALILFLSPRMSLSGDLRTRRAAGEGTCQAQHSWGSQ